MQTNNPGWGRQKRNQANMDPQSTAKKNARVLPGVFIKLVSL